MSHDERKAEVSNSEVSVKIAYNHMRNASVTSVSLSITKSLQECDAKKDCNYPVGAVSIRNGRSLFYLGSQDPLQKYIREAKRMMYWYKTKMYYFLN